MSEFSPQVQPSDADVIGSSEDFMLADNDPTTSDSYSISDIVEHFTGEYNPDLARLIRDSNYGSDLIGKAFVEDENSVVADDKITRAEFDQMVKDVSVIPEKTYDGGLMGGFSIADAVRFLDNRFSGPLTDEQKAEFRTVWSAIRDAVNDPENESDLYDKYMAAQKDGKLTMSEYVDLYNTAFPDNPITEEMINPENAGLNSDSDVSEILLELPGESEEEDNIESQGISVPIAKDGSFSLLETAKVLDNRPELTAENRLQIVREIIKNHPNELADALRTENFTQAKWVELHNLANPDNPITLEMLQSQPVIVEAEPVQETVVEGSPEAVAPTVPVEAPTTPVETVKGDTILDIAREIFGDNEFIDADKAADAIANNTDPKTLDGVLNNGTTPEEFLDLLNALDPDNQYVIVPKDDPARPYEIKPVQLAPEFNAPEVLTQSTVQDVREAVPTYKVDDGVEFVQQLNGVDILGVKFVGEGDERQVVITGENGAVLTDENGYMESYVKLGENELQVVGKVSPEGENGVRLDNFTVNNDKGEGVLKFDNASITPEVTTIVGNISIGDTEANGLGAIKADKIEIKGQEVFISNASASNIQAENIHITNLEAIRNLGPDVGYLQLSDFNLKPVGDKFELSIDLNKDSSPDIVLEGVVLENGNIGPVADVLAGLNMNSFLLSLTGGEAYTPAPRETVETTPATPEEITQPEQIKDYTIQDLRESSPTYEYKGNSPDKPTEFSQFFDGHKVVTVKLDENGDVQGYGASGELLTNEGKWESYASINGETLKITGEIENSGPKDVLSQVDLNKFNVTNEEGESVLSIGSGKISPEITKLFNVEVGDTSSNGLGSIEADMIVIEGSKVDITNLTAIEGDVRAASVEVNLEQLRKEGADLSNMSNDRLIIGAKDGKFDVTILGEDGEPMVVIKGGELEGENNLANVEKMLKNLTFNSFLASMVGGDNLDGITPISQGEADITKDIEVGKYPDSPKSAEMTTEEKEKVKSSLEESEILDNDPAGITPDTKVPSTSPATQSATAPQGDGGGVEQTPGTQDEQNESVFILNDDGSGVQVFEGFAEAMKDSERAKAVITNFEPGITDPNSDAFKIRMAALQNLDVLDLNQDGIENNDNGLLTVDIYNNAVDSEYYEEKRYIQSQEGLTLANIYEQLVGDNDEGRMAAFIRGRLNSGDQTIWNTIKSEEGSDIPVATPRIVDKYVAKNTELLGQLEASGEPFILLEPSMVKNLNDLAPDPFTALGNIGEIKSIIADLVNAIEPGLTDDEYVQRTNAIVDNFNQFKGLSADYLITFDEYKSVMQAAGITVKEPTKE